MKRLSAGNTFSEDEVKVLDYICSTLLRGGDPRQVLHHKAFASLCRKAIAMKASISRKKQMGVEVVDEIGEPELPSG